MLLKLRDDRDFFLRCCGLILTCTGVLASVLNVISAVTLAGMPFEMNYEEGNILNSAVRITQGLTPYPDPHSFPNVLSPYGPIPYYLTAVAVKLTGVNLFFPRLTVIMATLICATFAGLLVHRFTSSIPLSIAFGCLFITSRLVFFWMPFLRVDLLGLALTLIGLYLFGLDRRRWPWSILFFVAAIFVKYSLLAAPAACCVYLLLEKRWKDTVIFAGVLAGAIAALFAVVEWSTSGYFAFHMFGTHADPFLWSEMGRYLRGMMQLDFPLTALAVIYLVFVIVERKPNLPALYLIFAMLGSVTLGKLGSDSNHLLELHAACVLCSGLALARIARQLKPSWVALGATTVATVLLAFYGLKNPRVVDERDMAKQCGNVYAFVQQANGEILSDNIGLLVLTGKPVYLSNPFVYRYLVAKGWSDRELQERIHAQRFSAIVLSSSPWSHAVNESQHWTPEVLTEIMRNYRLAGQFQCTEATSVLLPKKLADDNPAMQKGSAERD